MLAACLSGDKSLRRTTLLPFEPLHQLLDPLRQGVAEVVESIAKPSHFVFRRFVVGLEMSGPLSDLGYLPGGFLADLGVLGDVLPKRPSEPCSDYREDRDDAPEGFLGHTTRSSLCAE